MELFTIDQLNELATSKVQHSVTIYSPTRRQSTDNFQQDKIHFKNQLQAARQQLVNLYGMEPDEVNQYLQPGFALLDNDSFWHYSSEMLAFFLTPRTNHVFKFPLKVDEPSFHVGKGLMLRPLLPLFNQTGRFYIMNLDLEDTRLYEVTPHSITDVDLGVDIPRSVNDYLQYIEIEKESTVQRRFQTGRGSGSAGNSSVEGGVFHGQSGDDEAKEQIHQWFIMLTRALENRFKVEQVPVIFAGVEYLIPIYRSTAHYNRYEDQVITGNFSSDNPNDIKGLHQKALAIMEPKFKQQEEKAIEQYHNLKAGDFAASDTEKIILAALTGQVDTLFLRKDASLWGHFDEQRYELQIQRAATPENTDLLTEAAVKTVLMKGKVYLYDANEMPEKDSVVAAVFRNPVVV
ncbi:hypothetical protein [Telluribacter sp. SYSU D00476]|uniref:baeRF7 domain-containing protein n=1 Tax=Telluribacter sp. SYSU D00476 TaxID=2811430 RepID=UPI001FF4F7EB|nr:hypothetical protein [Telluribacter sp. SYSU D00476]